MHSLRPTAVTNVTSHEADIAKVQDWFGHADSLHYRSQLAIVWQFGQRCLFNYSVSNS